MKKIKVTKTNQNDVSFIPAIKAIPTWYKKATSKINGKDKQFDWDGKPIMISNTSLLENVQYGETFKHCVPLLDAMTMGYMIVLEEDVVFDESKIDFESSNFVQSQAIYPYESAGYPVSAEFHERMFKWTVYNHIELPKGYTSLYVSPMHRMDLPFYTLPGIIDQGHPLEVNPPFIMKKGFTGVIPKGTPIVQIIPFKNDHWQTIDNGFEVLNQSKKFYDFFEFNSVTRTPISGPYKKKVRKRKHFE
jgi:hypothetical protein